MRLYLELLIDATTGPVAKAYDFVLENLARATAMGGKPVGAELVELSTIRVHRLPVPFSGSNSLTRSNQESFGRRTFPIDHRGCRAAPRLAELGIVDPMAGVCRNY
jgi:hypothetical protein